MDPWRGRKDFVAGLQSYSRHQEASWRVRAAGGPFVILNKKVYF